VPHQVLKQRELPRGQLHAGGRPGRQWAAVSGKSREPGREPRPRMRATYHRTEGVRHLFAAYDLSDDKLLGHVKPRKTRAAGIG
jgi:hypothetical protein